MFDFLKKKLTDFTGKLKETLAGKAEEQKGTAQPPAQVKVPEAQPGKVAEPEPAQKTEVAKSEEKPQEQVVEKTQSPEAPEPAKEEQKPQPPKSEPASIKISEPEEKKETKIEPAREEKQEPTPKPVEPAPREEPKQEPVVVIQEKPALPKPELIVEKPIEQQPAVKSPAEPEKKKGIAGAIMGLFGTKKKEEPKPEVKKKQPKEKPLAPQPQPPKPEPTKIAVEQKPAPQKIEIFEKPAPKEPEKRELKADTGLFGKLTGLVLGKITITEKDTKDFFEELELSLLESDVEQDTALAIIAQLQKQLVGREIAAGTNLGEFLNDEIKKALAQIMSTQKIDLDSFTAKPLKILFLGPNGAGKTTSIAKVANYFLKKNKTVLLAAGDTYRAASIEQLEVHANKLGVKIVKQNYGADPAAVAFDAIKAAEAKGIDVVLIDTAGRQETNMNLVEELKKIQRVAKPDLKIYVGEAYTGQALLQQATEFNNAVGIDGFILTKIDTDAKGGTAISLLHTLKKPILFVGTGQGYDDLQEFTPQFILDRII